MNDVNTKFITRIIVGITFVVFLAYFLNFHQHLRFSENTANWGTFGDYIGGILNPTIAFFAFYLIAKTYDLQKQELEETRKLLEISTANQIQQVELTALTALLNAKLMRIDSLKTDYEKCERAIERANNAGTSALDIENMGKNINNEISKLEKECKDLEIKIGKHFFDLL